MTPARRCRDPGPMETTAPRPAAHETPPVVLAAVLLEVVGPIVTVTALWNLFVNKLDTVLAFFGETGSVAASNVSAYRTWALVLVVAVLVPVASSLWRRGSLAARLFHVGVAAVALIGLILFQVSCPCR